MAKTKKKNSNYGGAAPGPKKPSSPRPQGLQYGLPGWAVVLCLAILGVALALRPGVDAPAWKNTLAYFCTGGPALVLALGQRKVKQESDSRMAGILMAIFAFIGALYLFSGVTSLGELLGA